MRKLHPPKAAAVLLVLFLSGLFLPGAASDHWEKTIQAFESADRVHPPQPNGIVFIGSSSIVKWDLGKYFPGMPVLNRGFGGSQIADSVRYEDRILLPYKPRIVVFYAGDNDIAAGKSPEQVLADYKAFVAKLRRALPATRLVYIAIKPSIRRWNLVEKMRRANQMIREIAVQDPLQEFVDIDPPMIGADGKPRPELFAPDGLHLSPVGYKLWTAMVLPYLR